jgi:2,3-bisphosphoglycerate-dependent phosphoglycerate mutase
MDRRTTLYLVRHAESAPSNDVPEPDWPLSARGVAQAAALVPALRGLGARAIYSSPYRRAVQTVAPLGAALGLTVTAVDALRERSLGRMFPDSELPSVFARCWAEPEFAPPGGESNAGCARRVAGALAELAGRHPGEAIVVASHGNAVTLYLGTIDPSVGIAFWRAMRNPDLFRVVYDGDCPAWDGARWPAALDP